MSKQTELESFLSGANALFLEQIYATYSKDPQSVDVSWRSFFDDLGDDKGDILQEALGASWASRTGKHSFAYGFYSDETLSGEPIAGSAPATKAGKAGAAAAKADGIVDQEQLLKQIKDAIRAQMLIRVYRVRGHLNAHLDPIDHVPIEPHPELDPQTYGFTDADMDREIYLGGSLGFEKATLREILHKLKETYCKSIGVEFMHIQEPNQKTWVQMNLENSNGYINRDDQVRAFQYLTRAEKFETFLAKKYPGAKRFGLEGGESLIPAIETILEDAATRGAQEVIFGMAHRGRLNMLANILEKPLRKIFSEFDGNEPVYEDAVQGSGDVKYHLGVSTDRVISGREVHLSLPANPSHLESVNPVVVGKVRAKQARLKDAERLKVIPILIHGDAAFAGQGLVSETLGLSELRGYKVGGTVHVIINNQIGFTTAPHFSRSSPYCSDIVKAIQAPVFHVNGDDVNAVLRAAKLASEFRAQFKKDVVLDIYCYRRHGHNEIDDPSFTQPLMYDKIRNHDSTLTLYTKELLKNKVISQDEATEISNTFEKRLDEEFEAAKEQHMYKADWLDGVWAGLQSKIELDPPIITGAPSDILDKVAKALTSYPESFKVHHRLARLLDQKKQALEAGEGIDWATGEALAFGTLLLEGYPVRLSGQDCGRGTFSQRHAVMIDQENAAPYVPLNNIATGQREAEIIDSPLSEASVLGFEVGYSLADPNVLVMWEAQFGDFANGAQVIFDQFICSGESKWNRLNGLVMLLPHGYEGQGPEHSSARFERYLQACAEDNMFVANCTTPANYFHILRRQMHLNTRKPLVVMTPKSLLRHKLAISKLSDMAGKTYFEPVFGEIDGDVTASKVKRIVLCTGKVYYDLLERRREKEQQDVAILRIEELYPFPKKRLLQELNQYTNAQDVIWCQEEPENMGAWTFVDRRLENALHESDLKVKRPCYVGRAAAASPATGSAKKHIEQQKSLVEKALELTK